MSRPYYEADGITLYLGDCREVEAWLAADLLVTDPPYGMAFVSSWTTRRRPIANDRTTEVRDAALALWAARGPAAVFGTWKAPRPDGVVNVLVWDKSDATGPGMGDLSEAFGFSHEEIYLLGEWPKRDGQRRRGSVFRSYEAIGGPNGLVARAGHPTPKPVGLLQEIIAASSATVVADPFCGSGSTLLAAKGLGLRAVGVELEERYCEVAAHRLSQGVLDFGGADAA